MRTSHGFSLIEMAIVLVILGIAITVVIPPIVTSIRHEKRQEGKDAILSVKHGIVGYFRNEKELPTNSSIFPEKGIGPSQDVWGTLYLYKKATFTGTDLCSNTTTYQTQWHVSVNGTSQNASFILVSYGQDHANDTDYGASDIRLDNLDDDLVEYMTLDQLRYYCPY